MSFGKVEKHIDPRETDKEIDRMISSLSRARNVEDLKPAILLLLKLAKEDNSTIVNIL